MRIARRAESGSSREASDAKRGRPLTSRATVDKTRFAPRVVGPRTSAHERAIRVLCAAMRIVHLSAEVAPFAKTGGLGDVVGALPKAQAELGHEVVVVMPLYREVRRALSKLGIVPEWVTEPMRIHLGFRAYEIGFLQAKLPGSSVPVYFIGSDMHFDRPHLYARPSAGADDGLLR
jgi:hypothetical protein